MDRLKGAEERRLSPILIWSVQRRLFISFELSYILLLRFNLQFAIWHVVKYVQKIVMFIRVEKKLLGNVIAVQQNHRVVQRSTKRTDFISKPFVTLRLFGNKFGKLLRCHR